MEGKIKESISIREINKIEELVMLRDLEKLIWKDDDPIPVHLSTTVIKNGGMAIGAFIENQLVGFQFSFPGYDGTNAYLCSHNLGIHPDYRKLGIGEMIKMKQKEKAIELGYRLIEWTYDPLETVNGYLNLTKLGGICTQYIENCYGDLPDALNAGLPSDRFLVEWRIDKKRPHFNKEDYQKNIQDSPVLIDVKFDEQGFPNASGIKLNQENALLRVPVPNNFQQIKANNIDLALDWRMKTRAVFQHYLEKGWSVTALEKSSNTALYHYILEKKGY